MTIWGSTTRPRPGRMIAAVSPLRAGGVLVTACSSSGGTSQQTAAQATGSGASLAGQTITLYNGQHEQTTDALVKAFEKQTGVTVKVRSDDEDVLAQQIAQEGSHSPADVFYTENTPPLVRLDEKGMLAPVTPAALADVPAADSAADHHWVGASARLSSLGYNTSDLKHGQLPTSVLGLADPKWKGKLDIAPSETDFQPIVTSVDAQIGDAATVKWLKALKANAGVHADPDNETLVANVNKGVTQLGVINHYYWYRLKDEVGQGPVRAPRRRLPAGRVRSGGAQVQPAPAGRPGSGQVPGQPVRPAGPDQERQLGVPDRRRRHQPGPAAAGPGQAEELQPDPDRGRQQGDLAAAAGRTAVRRPRGLLFLAAGAVAAGLLLPEGFLLVQAHDAGWAEVRSVLFRRLSGTLLASTAELAVLVTAATAIIGTAAAWCVERTSLPGRRVWAVLMVLPVSIPDFVVGYAWHSLFPNFIGLHAAAVVMTLDLYPLVYLPVAAALRRTDPALEESAHALGLGKWATFRRVVLPQIRPAVLGGSLVVILALL